MKPPLYLDLETYCEVPITHGTHAYAESAEVMLFAYAIGDGPAKVWDCTQNKHVVHIPIDLHEALEDPEVLIYAHNSQFDRTVLRHAAPCKAAKAAAENRGRWRDTMVQALAHSLPGSLSDLCEIYRLPTDKAKDKAGKGLIQLFCKPRPANSKISRATSATHPDDWARFVSYAASDIEAMRVLAAKLPKWNYQGDELALWHLDQRINDRGFLVDLELAQGAIHAVDGAQKKLAARTKQLTGGAVESATKRDAMLRHMLEAYGVELPDLQQSTLERRITDPDLPPELRELLAIRMQASTTSTSKYKTLLKGVSKDGRLRGTLQFNGASRTGRWAGRLFQPQNLPRPVLGQDEIDMGIGAIKAGCADLVAPTNVMELTSSAIRGCIIAPPEKKLVVADLSNIEGRMLAWLAGEQWKLNAFADYDRGIGHDLYKLAYAKAFGIRPEDVDKAMRQIGKVMELALGYEGGVGAFLTFAAAYNIDLEEMANLAMPAIPQAIINESNSALAWTKLNRRPTFGLTDKAWVVCDSLKRLWRYAHPETTAFWKELETAAVMATATPGQVFKVRRLKVQRVSMWLRVALPSGRNLCYPGPQVDDGKLSYLGVNQYSRKWGRLKTYGGKLVENVTQAASRDILGTNMPAIEQAGYDIVLSVHDENITEAPDNEFYNAEHLADLMATNPEWATGLPLAAAGFEDYRYRKD